MTGRMILQHSLPATPAGKLPAESYNNRKARENANTGLFICRRFAGPSYLFQEPPLAAAGISQFINFFDIADDAAAAERKHGCAAVAAFFRLENTPDFYDDRPAVFFHAEADGGYNAIAGCP